MKVNKRSRERALRVLNHLALSPDMEPFLVAMALNIPLPDADLDREWTPADVEEWVDKSWAAIGRAVGPKIARLVTSQDWRPDAKRGRPRGKPNAVDFEILRASKRRASMSRMPFNKTLRESIAIAMKTGRLNSGSAFGTDVAAAHFRRIKRLEEKYERAENFLLNEIQKILTE